MRRFLLLALFSLALLAAPRGDPALPAGPPPDLNPILYRGDLPVSAWLELRGAAASDLNERPPRYWVVAGAPVELTFTIAAALAGETQMTLDLPSGVTHLAGETAWQGSQPQHSLAVRVRFDQPGEFRLSALARHPRSAFQNTAAILVRVVASAEAARREVEATCPQGLCGRAKVLDGLIRVDGRPQEIPAVPSGTAHIYGVAVTYPFTDTRQYPLRGLKIELWQDVSGGPDVQLGSPLYTKESSTEGRCGLSTGGNYVEGNTWVHTAGENAGTFDFGNLEMGTGKQLYFKLTYVFADGGTGLDGSGTPQIAVRDDASPGDPLITHESARFWAYSGNTYFKLVAPPDLGTAGTLADEAAHVFYDLSRMYGYLRDCVGETTSYVTAYLDLANTGSPTSAGGAIYYRGSTTSYLTYQPTSTIVHEFGHSLHYFMRGASYPPYDPAGYPPVIAPDTWHGNCANTTSAGGLTEGWAHIVQAVYYADPRYKWGAGITPKDFSLNTGEFAECENSEWTFAAILWDLWTEVGQGDDPSFAEIAVSLADWDPDYIRDFYDGYTSDWNLCYPSWLVFDNHNVTYPTCAPPAAPSALNASSSWQDQTYLTWTNNSANKDDFHLERSPNGSASWLQVAVTPNTWQWDSGLACGTTYYYRLRAHRHGDWIFSSYSTAASATTAACDPPAAPTSLSATALSSSQVRLDWTDNSGNESDFHIERSPNGSSSWTEVTQVSAGTTTWTNGGLACATPYYYRLRAHRHGDGAYSSYSGVAGATTQACAPLSPPSNLSIEPMSTSRLDLTWADNSTNESNFRLERSYDGLSGWSEIAVNPANDVTYSNTGLDPAATYFYRVRAFRSSDNSYSDYSNVASGKTYYTVFNAPAYLSLDVRSPTQIDLLWTDSTFDESQFRIERSLDGTNWSQIATVGANVNTFSHTSLDCDTLYDYRVRAYRQNDNTFSGYSPVKSARTQVCPGDPRAPTGLIAVEVTEISLVFAWVDNSSDESDFHLEQSTRQDYGWVDLGPTWNHEMGTVYGSCEAYYYYRVRAHRHSDDSSSYSNVILQPFRSCGDDFWRAHAVSPLNFQHMQSVDQAVTAPDDPNFTCVSGSRYRSVWFKYTATADATLTVRTLGSTYDTVLAVWTGFSPELLVSQACNDNFSGSTSQVSLSQVKGATYYFEVASMTENPTFNGLVLEASITGAATPSLTHLLPDWKAAGMPDFTLTVYGDNFIDGVSKVRWNGSNRPTTFMSGTRLEAAISAADIAAAGSSSLTVSNSSAGGGVSTALSLLVAEPVTFEISAGPAGPAPSLDGRILPADWAAAQTYNITAPNLSGALSAFPAPGLLAWTRYLLSPALPLQPLATVTLYVMNNATHLYLAFDNPNDPALHASDEVLVYFDDATSPSDGLWNPSQWCHTGEAAEGYFYFTPSLKRFYETCSTGAYSPVENAPGLVSAFGVGSGHLQVELSLDLGASALDPGLGQAVNMYLRLKDGNANAIQAAWPMNGADNDPASFQPLFLQLARLFLPLTFR